MKEKKRYAPTRRRKALTRTAICLLTILMAVYVCHYGFFPSSALRRIEEEQGTGRTKVVTRLRDIPPEAPAKLYYLSENENALLCSAVNWYFPYGWNGLAICRVDCSKEAPIHICNACINTGGGTGEEPTHTLLFFGRIDDPQVAGVEIFMDYINESLADETYTVDNFLEKRGNVYFLWQQDGFVYQSCRMYANCYDKDGSLVYTTEITY